MAVGAMLLALTLWLYDVESKAYRRSLLLDLMADLLTWVCECIEGSRPVSGSRPRANIMLIERAKPERAVIVAHARMDGAADLDITLVKGEGCAGRACESKELMVGDLSEINTAKEYRCLEDATGAVPWRISKKTWELTKDLRTVISQPLLKATNKTKVIGMLNVDDILHKQERGYELLSDEGRIAADILRNAEILAELLANEYRWETGGRYA